MTRTLFGFCACLIAGEAVAGRLDAFAALWPAAVILTAFVAFAGYGFRVRGWPFAAVFLAGLSLMMAFSDRRLSTLNALRHREGGGPLVATLVVHGDVTPTSFMSEIRGMPVEVIYARETPPHVPAAGERWEVAGWLDAADEPGRHPRLWVRGEGTGLKPVGGAKGLRAWIARLRASFLRRVGIGLDRRPDIADINRAILLGERSAIPFDTRQAFVRAGTMHLFAISGLHVMIVAYVIVFLLGILFVPLRATVVALLPALWGYVLIVGCGPSAVRAAMMISLGFAAFLLGRRPNGLVAWAVTFLAVYGTSPARLTDVGCALSFAVMLGLLLSGRVIDRHAPRPLKYPLITICAWLSGLPIAASVFGHITPGGLLANLALIPLASLEVAASFLGVLTSFVSETVAVHCNNLAALLTRAMLGLSESIASLPIADFPVSRWSVTLCIEWYAVFALTLWLADSVLSRHHRTL